jgi:hypothetical protein
VAVTILEIEAENLHRHGYAGGVLAVLSAHLTAE